MLLVLKNKFMLLFCELSFPEKRQFFFSRLLSQLISGINFVKETIVISRIDAYLSSAGQRPGVIIKDESIFGRTLGKARFFSISQLRSRAKKIFTRNSGPWKTFE